MLNLSKLSLGIAITGSLMLGACSTISPPIKPEKLEAPRLVDPHNPSNTDYEPPAKAVGGSYHLDWYTGLPGRRQHAVRITAQVIDDVSYIEHRDCASMLKQQAGAFESVGNTTLRTTLGGASVGMGALSIPYANPIQYTGYGAGAGFGAGLLGGIGIHNMAKHIELGQCVGNHIRWAASWGEFPRGVGAILNDDTVEGRKVARPDPSPDDAEWNKKMYDGHDHPEEEDSDAAAATGH